MNAQNRRVLVDGATGYLGSHLISKLCELGYEVHALVHPGARSNDVDFLRQLGARVFTADLTSPPQTDAFDGCAAVVHLIGSVAPKKGEKLIDLHAGQTRNLVGAAKKAGVQRIVMITTVGANQHADNSYHQTKWLAEEELRKSGIEYVILRPPLLVGHVVGSRDSKLVNRYREIILGKKMVPLINGGQNKVQPMFIGDLVNAIVECLNTSSPQVLGKELEVGGPEVVTLRQFVERFMESLGTTKPIVTLHPALASVLAVVCEATQNVPTVNRDQVKLALGDNICTENSLTTLLNVKPTALKTALDSYKSAKQSGANVSGARV